MLKKKVLWILMPILLLIVAGVAEAAITITSATMATPTASGTVFGTYKLNATVVGGTDDTLKVNITYQAKSSSTANSSWTNVCTVTNINLSIDTNTNCSAFNNVYAAEKDLSPGNGNLTLPGAIEDSNDYQFRVIVTQYDSAANTKTSAAVSNVVVDYTTPSTPTSVQPSSNTKYENGQVNIRINATVTDSVTTGCYLSWIAGSMSGAPTDTMTYSATSCYESYTSVPDGNYEFEIYAFDGTNSSSSSGNFFVTFDNKEMSPAGKVIMMDEIGQGAEVGLNQEAKGSTSKNIAILVILLLVGYVFVNRNKT